MILMNDFVSEPESLKAETLKSMERVLRSGWYILGTEVKQFELDWSKTCRVAHSIGVANGMDAIEIGLRCAGIETGDEVITTPMTAFATVLAIIRAGAVPVLADIDPNTGLLSMASVETCITKKTKAVLLVHLYGHVRNLATWKQFCEDRKILLLEDCAQAHLAESDGFTAGTAGLWGAYSFYPTKNLGAIGDAGALITNDNGIAQAARIHLNYGQSKRYHHPILGLNSRLDEMQAAILAVRLKVLSANTNTRRRIAQKYRLKISNPMLALPDAPLVENNHVHHLFIVLCSDRDRLAEYMKSKGVETLIHYPIPIHHQPPCINIRHASSGLHNAELHAQRCLSIPCHPYLTDSETDAIIEALNDFT
jgi:dTDP-4-amino-4,6-dideoxygalactose transaminase